MKLTVDNLNKQAYDALKGKIINKEFPPGMRLVDSQLAKEYGISRTPLRDAIRKLNEDGLVIRKNNGYFIFQPSIHDIEEIFELRLMMDIAAVTKLITEVLPNNSEAYEQLMKSYESTLDPVENSTNFVRSDEDFHDIIIRLTGNTRMISFYSDIRNQTRAFRRITSYNANRVQQAQNFHEKIFLGLKNLDLDMAIAAIEKHIALSKQDALLDFMPEDKEANYK